jgi:pimeloyl-ACP methyl ester carboxylesterase
MERHTITNDGVPLRCMTDGSPERPLVVLLHGFPARWSTWRQTMRPLAQAGFYVAAPDLRGYGESAKPKGIQSYAIDRLVDDVTHVIHELGKDWAFIVGHDFGGGVAWATAMMRPEAVRALALLNSVHPVGFEQRIRYPSQLARSWYIFFFQIPWLPELMLAQRDFQMVRHALAKDGLPPDTISDLLEGVRPEGALTATINWYRAVFRDGLRRRFQPRKVDVPAMIIWGDGERYLDPELADPPAGWVSNVRTEHIHEASHWVHHDSPERVASLLIDHFASVTPGAASSEGPKNVTIQSNH